MYHDIHNRHSGHIIIHLHTELHILMEILYPTGKNYNLPNFRLNVLHRLFILLFTSSYAEINPDFDKAVDTIKNMSNYILSSIEI